MSRFLLFTSAELESLSDGLMAEAEIDPTEDPSFPARVATAEALMAEIDRELHDESRMRREAGKR